MKQNKKLVDNENNDALIKNGKYDFVKEFLTFPGKEGDNLVHG